MHPQRVASPRDMIKLNTHHVVASASHLASAHKYISVLRRAVLEQGGHSFSLEIERFVQMRECAVRLNMVGRSLGLVSPVRAGERLVTALDQAAPSFMSLTPDAVGPLLSYIDQLISSFDDELSARSVVVMSTMHGGLFAAQAPLFGEAVANAFPSSTQEIADAGNCVALGQWTAAVLHLMRALEPALNKLAEAYEVKPEQNWNKALNEIDAKLSAVQKSKEGSEAEQWAAAAVLQFRAIKNAFRNHAAHGRSRYNEAETLTIYSHVQGLMVQISQRFSE
jgi:hypothetical protein